MTDSREDTVLVRAFSLEPMTRHLDNREADVDADERTARLAFSSEEPVERYFGDEVLDHGAESVRLTRMENGAPLLVNHDLDDQVGVIESVSLDEDRVGRALVRFGRSARASEILQDVNDGIRRKVSVMYRIHKM